MIRSKYEDINKGHCFVEIIFTYLSPVSFDEIKQLIISSQKSTCQSDTIPSNLMPLCVDNIVPIIIRFVDLSLNTYTFPNEFKSAFVKSLLKNRFRGLTLTL